ncbi:hypothetical protein VB834_26720 [Limnoraphis robusta Tam1]|uniref:hypothetical protein n=1 Tax=Limnoraphis robusta TaxID=1118279 RepID=UPI002B20DFCF|nr:hypothetical protein [Limnoraphis robusta]MEA5542629.1 hypothetical protein [Limnoraphis robusta Tam1]
MVAKEMTANSQTPQNIILLKSITAIGVTVFSGFMFMSWQNTLSEYQKAEQSKKEVATQITPTTASTTPVKTEPVAANSTQAITQPPVSTTAENPSTPIVNSIPPRVEADAEITDPKLIESLNQKLYNQVDTAWQETPTFSDNLVYQVKVQENGEIADYSPLNEAAVQHLSEVPLDNLQDKKAGELSAKVAKFLVVLTPSGSLQVNPWIAN